LMLPRLRPSKDCFCRAVSMVGWQGPRMALLQKLDSGQGLHDESRVCCPGTKSKRPTSTRGNQSGCRKASRSVTAWLSSLFTVHSAETNRTFFAPPMPFLSIAVGDALPIEISCSWNKGLAHGSGRQDS
jgi:hypothetical protein